MLWFRPDELLAWEQPVAPLLYELPSSRIAFDDDDGGGGGGGAGAGRLFFYF